MKWFFLFLGIISAAINLSYGEGRSIDIQSLIGPSISASTITPQGSISSGGTNKYNCITTLTAVSTNSYTVRILDGGTTFYQMTVAGNEPLYLNRPPTDPYCGTANTAMTIKLDIEVPGTTSVNLNWAGFVGR